MTQAEHIISRFGGLTALSRRLGHRHPSTVQGWQKRGWIPAEQQPIVLQAGQNLSPPLTANEFFICSELVKKRPCDSINSEMPA